LPPGTIPAVTVTLCLSKTIGISFGTLNTSDQLYYINPIFLGYARFLIHHLIFEDSGQPAGIPTTKASSWLIPTKVFFCLADFEGNRL
jgi:hypothetical protein